jgi:magnesium-transporting ATPase (P-type)
MSVLIRRTYNQDGDDSKSVSGGDAAKALADEASDGGMSGDSIKVNCSTDSRPRRNDEPEGYCVLYAKGADNVMFDRLSNSEENQLRKKAVQSHLKSFSQHGLRTLVVAKRVLTGLQAKKFEERMHDAKTALMNREKNMEEVADEMEQNFAVVGVSAIEDKIQEGVPETIDMLLRAGVKIWMLTGDNMETAINIGLACKLMHPGTQQYALEGGNDCDAQDLWDLMDGYYGKIFLQMKKMKAQGLSDYSLFRGAWQRALHHHGRV